MKLKLTLNDSPVLFSKPSKDNKGKIHIISSKPDPQLHDDGYSGFVRVHQNGARFTLVTANASPNDNCDGEIMGIAFIKESDDIRDARQMRIILENDMQPYYPLSEEVKLSKLAKTGNLPDETNRFFSITTKLPHRNKSGTLSLCFGNAFVVASINNFLINLPDDSKCILQFYKQSNDAYSVKIGPPCTLR